MIRTTLGHLHVAALSHAGLSGKNNEDRYAVSSFQLAKDDARPAIFAVVADGIGGHRSGDGPPRARVPPGLREEPRVDATRDAQASERGAHLGE